MTGEIPKPTVRLQEAGEALWRRVLADVPDEFELTAVELHLLESACRCRDEIARLEDQIDGDGAVVKGSRGQPVLHPAIAEARQLRLAEQRLLKSIDTPAEPSPVQTRAQQAAATRWNRERRQRVERRAS
jgi:Phage terminase, small subunit